MNDSINIHEKIQEMMKYKFKGKQKFPYSQNIPKIKMKKIKHKPYRPLGFSDENRRNTILQESKIVCNNRLSQDFSSELLNKASMIIEQREYNMKNIKLSETSPDHLQSEKQLVNSLLEGFQETQEDNLLTEARKNLHSKLVIKEPKPARDSNIIDLVKLPIIANAKNLNVIERKRGLNKWGQNDFHYNKEGSISFNDQMTSFIKEVDKQKIQHENFKIRVHKQIDRIEYMRDEAFHHKYLGELLEMKSSYKFHDLFMRCRKVKNHLNIQQL